MAKILIADDHRANREALAALLESVGHYVLTAADGNQALNLAKDNRPELIISDVLMPNMDGFRFCLEVRKSSRFRALPFILYTATYTSPEDRRRAQAVGADDYISKPASPVALLDALRTAASQTVVENARPPDFQFRFA